MSASDFANKRLISLWNEYQEKGGTQVSLAAASGVTQGQISIWIMRLKSGSLPKLDGVEALAGAFGVDLASVFPPPTKNPALISALIEIATLLPALKEGELDMLLRTIRALAKKGTNLVTEIPGKKNETR